MENPRIFISYSWSSPEQEQRVLDIATELVECGIDVVLDKWNLKEGDDADAFMEQMVSDPSIEKVLIVCDKMYSEKSDKRKVVQEQKLRLFLEGCTNKQMRASLL